MNSRGNDDRFSGDPSNLIGREGKHDAERLRAQSGGSVDEGEHAEIGDIPRESVREEFGAGPKFVPICVNAIFLPKRERGFPRGTGGSSRQSRH